MQSPLRGTPQPQRSTLCFPPALTSKVHLFISCYLFPFPLLFSFHISTSHISSLTSLKTFFSFLSFQRFSASFDFLSPPFSLEDGLTDLERWKKDKAYHSTCVSCLEQWHLLCK